MEIKTVSIIGLGALGTMFGHYLAGRMPREDLRIIADQARLDRYRRERVYCNGERCEFHYVDPETTGRPADLVLFAVKYNGLAGAISEARNQVGEKSVILSLLNGISSEEMIGRVYGMDKVLYCVAQGMDAVKEGNRLTYQNLGMLCFGEGTSGANREKSEAVSRFFSKVGLPHAFDPDMKKRLWGKFMLNVGINQTVAVYQGDYGQVQREGPERDMMISAMREVIALSEPEGIFLTEDDLRYWLKVIAPLSPSGKPSMRQDLEAGRRSEVELFAGTVLTLAEKHGISCPTNEMLYRRIREMESRFDPAAL
jgi:2-dehydropantoate 2-reductase